jgi:uncharacterized protein with HEPN domain
MKSNVIFIKHILEEINFLHKETAGLTFEVFMKNEVLKRACARSLEIIGEAVKNISDDFKVEYKEIEWKKIAGLRDKIIHFYFGINWDIVWDVIDNKILELKIRLEYILKEIETDKGKI